MSFYGDVIAHTRDSRGFTQSQLAQLAGVSRQTVAALEKGSHDVKLSSLESVLDALSLKPAVTPKPFKPLTQPVGDEYELIATEYVNEFTAKERSTYRAIC